MKTATIFAAVILLAAQIISTSANVLETDALVIRYIKGRDFQNALKKIKEINKDELQSSINNVIHEVYNNNDANFDLLLQFVDSVSDKPVSLAIYRALDYELNSNPQKLTYKLKLIKSFNRKHFDSDVTGANELKSELDIYVRTLAVSQLSDALKSSNYDALSKLAHEIHENYHELFRGAFKEALAASYSQANLKKLVSFLQSHKLASQSVYAYCALFDELKSRKQLNQRLLVDLAFGLAEAYRAKELDREAALAVEHLPLPGSVRNLAFATRVCIVNADYPNEHMYAASDGFNYDDKRRTLYTWTPGGRVQQGKWRVERSGDVYHLKNEKHDEYLYAAYIDVGYYIKRRPVFTWIPKGIDSRQFNWVFVPSGDHVYINNDNVDEYLYASMQKKDDNRRKVFTWSERPEKPIGSLWTIQDCH